MPSPTKPLFHNPKQSMTKSKSKREKRERPHRGLRSKYRAEDFLRVARTGMTKLVEEKKTDDGYTIVNTKVSITDSVRMVLRNMWEQSGGMEEKSNLRIRLPTTNSSFCSSNGSGFITQVYSMDPSGSNNWTEFAAIFDQFRVTGGRLQVMALTGPVALNSATPYYGPIMAAFDNDAGASATANVVASYPNYKLGNIQGVGQDKFEYSFKRPDLDVYPFVSTSTPSSSLGSVLTFGYTLASVTNVAMFNLTLDLEFVGIR